MQPWEQHTEMKGGCHAESPLRTHADPHELILYSSFVCILPAELRQTNLGLNRAWI